MASTISAGTTTTTALSYSADTSGVLQLQTNGTTTAITIDTNQNVGVGVTPSAWSSSYKVIQNEAAAFWSATTGNGLNLTSGYYYNGTNNIYINSDYALRYSQNGGGTGAHAWYNAPSGTAGNAITFTQAMTLDASGNLLLGFTSGTSYKLNVKTSSAAQSAIGTSGTSGDTTYQAILITKFDNDSTTSQNFIQFQINNGGANCGKITANGANTAAFGSTCDQRVKENIVELPSQLANIMALRPVEFDYLESYGGGHQIGFIAQEIQQVYPDVISTDDSSEKIMSITGWSKTEARLVKAIQELAAQVTTLQTQVTALKG